MDTLFDEVSRILAQPRRRRATLRLVVGVAAGAAVGSVLPGRAFAWAPIPCGTTQCFPDQNQMCCDATLSLCCASNTCMTDAAGKSVCCPSGTRVCGRICCGTLETCCGGMCCETVAASSSVQPRMTCNISSGGAAVCAKVVTSCDAIACAGQGGKCSNGACVCDPATCAALSSPEFTLACNATTGTCLPVA